MPTLAVSIHPHRHARMVQSLAWSDPESAMAELASWSAVAQAMSEKVTGVRATPAVQDVDEWCAVPVPHLGLVLTSGRSPATGSVRPPSS